MIIIILQILMQCWLYTNNKNNNIIHWIEKHLDRWTYEAKSVGMHNSWRHEGVGIAMLRKKEFQKRGFLNNSINPPSITSSREKIQQLFNSGIRLQLWFGKPSLCKHITYKRSCLIPNIFSISYEIIYVVIYKGFLPWFYLQWN